MEVVAEPVGPGVEVRVRDTGIGISEEEQERVWEEFYRGSGARESGQEGTGLGLSIVKAIAEMHGGEIMLASEEGVGTTVRVRLPGTA